MKLSRVVCALVLCATASATTDPSAVLQRVLIKLRESIKVIPNYTCVETITRDYYTPIAPLKRACDVMLEMKEHPTPDMTLRRTSTDRLRLDVALTKNGEILSWVGESRFEDRSIDELIREGPVGTGVFAAMLASVFDQDVKTFRFVREIVVNGQDRLEYSFEAPREQSHYKVKVQDGWAIIGYHGTFDVDPMREELAALRMETAIFPPAAFTCRSKTEVEFTMTAIGAGVFPMASRARQRFVAADGSEANNTTQFSQCREYRGESTISFGESSSTGTVPAKATGPGVEPVPAGLAMAIELTAPINATTAAAGDRFTARLLRPLRDGRRTIAREGSRVEGRLVRVEMVYLPKPSAIFVLRPEVVEARGIRIPLAATRDLRREMDEARRKRVPIILPYQHEVFSGLFQVIGDKAILPKGAYSEWRTAAR